MSLRGARRTPFAERSPALNPKDCEATVDCQQLEWDSAFFGCRVGQGRWTQTAEPHWTSIEDWCVAHRIDCFCLLVDANAIGTATAALARGYYFTDVRVTLEARSTPGSAEPDSTASCPVRPWRPTDVPFLTRIASVSHRESRFYADPRFARSRCDALYATWIENSCHGYADVVLVGEVDGAVCGYVSCHIGPHNEGRIGLLAVSRPARGTGLGRTLVQHALAWFAARNCLRVQVVTQGRNDNAIRLYERCGFLTNRLQLWLHRWAAPPLASPSLDE